MFRPALLLLRNGFLNDVLMKGLTYGVGSCELRRRRLLLLLLRELVAALVILTTIVMVQHPTILRRRRLDRSCIDLDLVQHDGWIVDKGME